MPVVLEDIKHHICAILFLQDTASWPLMTSDALPSWVSFHTESKPTAIRVSVLSHLIRETELSGAHSAHLLGNTVIVSADLPNIWLNTYLYDLSLSHMYDICACLNRKEALNTLIGGGLQIELEPSIGQLVGPAAVGEAKAEARAARCQSMYCCLTRWGGKPPARLSSLGATARPDLHGDLIGLLGHSCTTFGLLCPTCALLAC